MNHICDLDDLAPGEPVDRAAAAAEAFSLHEVQGSDDPGFALAFGMLNAYFGPLGEIERESVIRGWLDRPEREIDGRTVRYHQIYARGPDGDVAAARDCYSVVEHSTGICVVYLAHAYVAERWRRGGVATLLRTTPATLARRALRLCGLPEDNPRVLAIEQEAIEPGNADTLIRLCAYGRGGFSVIEPACLPHQQPDFRDLEALGEPPKNLPFLAVVRWVGHESATELPARFAQAYEEALYTVFGSHCRPADLVAPKAHALDALSASGLDPVPLLRMPRGADDLDAIAALSRDRVLRFFPDTVPS